MKHLSFFILLGLLFSTQAFAATITVDTRFDEFKSNGNGCGLREAIESFNRASDYYDCVADTSVNAYGSNDTIVLDNGETYLITRTGSDNNNQNGDLDINSDVIITTSDSSGTKATIDISNAPNQRIFDIQNAVIVSLENLVLTGVDLSASSALAAGLEGGIINQRAIGSLTLNSIDIESNTIQLTNSPTIQGGLIYLKNGTGANRNTFSMSNTNIYNNSIAITSVGSASNGQMYGGIIYAENFTNITISDSDIYTNSLENNINTIQGGFLHSLSASTIEVSNSDFYTNSFSNTAATADNKGGLFYIDNSEFTLSQSSFYDNSFSFNGAGSSDSAFGGILFAENPNSSTANPIRITNVSILENTLSSTEDSYGFLYFEDPANVKIEFTTIAANILSATNIAYGNAISIGTFDVTLTLKSNMIFNSDITNNSTSAGPYGPNCYNQTSNPIVSSGYNFISDISDCSFTSDASDSTSASAEVSLIDSSLGGSTYVAIFRNMDTYLTSDCFDIDGNALNVDQRNIARDNPDTAESLCYAGAMEAIAYYTDNDGDGYGDADYSISYTSGDVSNNLDCDDSNADINPDANEVCDGIDNNCDEDRDIDEGLPLTTYYQDEDGDSFTLANVSEDACGTAVLSTITHPVTTQSNEPDCDDTSYDENNSGTVYYQDEDGDGYTLADVSEEVCDIADLTLITHPVTTQSSEPDCDDGDSNETITITYYVDGDNDGYRLDVSETYQDCSLPESGFTTNTDVDCDDDDSNVQSGTTATYYADNDGDGYGDSGNTAEACAQPSGYVTNSDDCDDTSALASPDVTTEDCSDNLDNDCDGATDSDDSECASSGGGDNGGGNSGGSNSGGSSNSGGADVNNNSDDMPTDDTTDDNSENQAEAGSSGGGCQLNIENSRALPLISVVCLLLPLAVLRYRKQVE